MMGYTGRDVSYTSSLRDDIGEVALGGSMVINRIYLYTQVRHDHPAPRTIMLKKTKIPNQHIIGFFHARKNGTHYFHLLYYGLDCPIDRVSMNDSKDTVYPIKRDKNGVPLVLKIYGPISNIIEADNDDMVTINFPYITADVYQSFTGKSIPAFVPNNPELKEELRYL